MAEGWCLTPQDPGPPTQGNTRGAGGQQGPPPSQKGASGVPGAGGRIPRVATPCVKLQLARAPSPWHCPDKRVGDALPRERLWGGGPPCPPEGTAGGGAGGRPGRSRLTQLTQQPVAGGLSVPKVRVLLVETKVRNGWQERSSDGGCQKRGGPPQNLLRPLFSEFKGPPWTDAADSEAALLWR